MMSGSSPKSSPVPIRFDPAVRARLQTLAEASGLSVSDVCRLAVEQFLSEAERTGRITFSVPGLAPAEDPKKAAKAKARGKKKIKNA